MKFVRFASLIVVTNHHSTPVFPLFASVSDARSCCRVFFYDRIAAGRPYTPPPICHLLIPSRRRVRPCTSVLRFFRLHATHITHPLSRPHQEHRISFVRHIRTCLCGKSEHVCVYFSVRTLQTGPMKSMNNCAFTLWKIGKIRRHLHFFLLHSQLPLSSIQSIDVSICTSFLMSVLNRICTPSCRACRKCHFKFEIACRRAPKKTFESRF
jgi:hypothetical protein